MEQPPFDIADWGYEQGNERERPGSAVEEDVEEFEDEEEEKANELEEFEDEEVQDRGDVFDDQTRTAYVRGFDHLTAQTKFETAIPGAVEFLGGRLGRPVSGAAAETFARAHDMSHKNALALVLALYVVNGNNEVDKGSLDNLVPLLPMRTVSAADVVRYAKLVAKLRQA